MEIDTLCGIDFLPERFYPAWFTEDVGRLRFSKPEFEEGPRLPVYHWCAREAVYKSLQETFQLSIKRLNSIELQWDITDFNQQDWNFKTLNPEFKRVGFVRRGNDSVVALAWQEFQNSPEWGEIMNFPPDIQYFQSGEFRVWEKNGLQGRLSLSHEYGRTFWAAYLPKV
jgi:hypothetical protein